MELCNKFSDVTNNSIDPNDQNLLKYHWNIIGYNKLMMWNKILYVWTNVIYILRWIPWNKVFLTTWIESLIVSILFVDFKSIYVSMKELVVKFRYKVFRI